MTDTLCAALRHETVEPHDEPSRRIGRPRARAGTKRDQAITLRFRESDYAALREHAAANHTPLRSFLRDLAISAATQHTGQPDPTLPSRRTRAGEGTHHDQAVTLRFSANELDAFTEQATAAETKIRPFLRELILISARALHDPSPSRDENSTTANGPEETNHA